MLGVSVSHGRVAGTQNSQHGVLMSHKKWMLFLLVMVGLVLLAGCQANYIRDVQGGTVAPTSTSTLTVGDTN